MYKSAFVLIVAIFGVAVANHGKHGHHHHHHDDDHQHEQEEAHPEPTPDGSNVAATFPGGSFLQVTNSLFSNHNVEFLYLNDTKV